MSEALSSTEIEDVLSSIRRLVSDDLRPSTRGSVVGQATMSGDKLMLTPALRVVADDAADVSDPPMFLRRPRPAATTDATGIEQVVASLGAAVGPQSTEWEAETGDSSPEFAEGQPTNDWTMPPQDLGHPDEAPPDDAPDDALAADLLPPENFVFSSGADLGDVILSAEASPEVIPGWAQQDDSALVDEDPDDAPQDTTAYGTLEPDPAWADAAEASVIASLSAENPDDDDAALLPEDDAMLFNEEVLRELVRDILREELAGKMGERITRNIRKLVRAEIARSFAAQEFD